MNELPNYILSLKKAIKDLRIADHIVYVTFPVIKDKRLLLKALDQIYESTILIVNSFLQYDYINKRIILSPNPKENYETFINKSSRNHNISSLELSEVTEIIRLAESHKKSPLEFQRREKIVIMSDSLKTKIVDIETLKKYLNLVKKLIERAKFSFSIL